MLVLGLSGNFSGAYSDLVPGMQEYFFHDATACLVRDGELVAAVEEERLNRIKKTTKFPINAIRACLARANVTPDEIDAVGYYFPENTIDLTLNHLYAQHRDVPARYSRELITEHLKTELGWDLPADGLHYAPHHLAHALSSFARSGMADALVVVLDAAGDAGSGSIYRGDGGRLELLGSYSIPRSLGRFYLNVTQLLGYGFGDEYKVMGLAPYGDPARFRDLFDELCVVRPDGDYEIGGDNAGLDSVGPALFARGLVPRRRGEAFTQEHKDIAAAAQEALERISLHVLGHWARATGSRRLCFGGGVAHNCTLNGAILRSGLFDEVFVHPASHDAGAADGAALAVEHRGGGAIGSLPPLRDAGLGPAIGGTEDIASRLADWGSVIEFEHRADIVETTARLLAGSAVIGWVQGAAEFGPRALGNRSIIADARPKVNQTRINAMVKKRESFRPFAPAVTPAAARDYFDLPATTAHYGFMSYVVHVLPDRRAQLGAVTHVDGTARVQITDPVAQPRFHRLVEEFGEITGTPVLLNTSFNNHAEPIVTTVDDAVACFLTTELDHLVIGDHLVRRHPDWHANLDRLTVRLRPTTHLTRTTTAAPGGGTTTAHRIHQDHATGSATEISADLHRVLRGADGARALTELGIAPHQHDELHGLWQQRFIDLVPARA
ncbi:carbamoyltransferase family protein [Saccharopolyspora sp. NPDC002578]